MAEELIELHFNTYYQCLSFLLVKKTITHLGLLRQALAKQELKGVTNWPELEGVPEFQQILEFIRSEEEIFNRFYERLSLKVLEEGTLCSF